MAHWAAPAALWPQARGTRAPGAALARKGRKGQRLCSHALLLRVPGQPPNPLFPRAAAVLLLLLLARPRRVPAP